MRIETTTTYRCDGCGVDNANPVGWAGIVPVHLAGALISVGARDRGEHYCSSCIGDMRKSVKAPAAVAD